MSVNPALLEDLDVGAVPRERLPALLGRLTELEARVRLRLAEASVTPPAAASAPPIDAERAAEISGTSKRWLLDHTRGMPFRCDLSRKQSRFNEAGLRRWLAERRSLAK